MKRKYIDPQLLAAVKALRSFEVSADTLHDIRSHVAKTKVTASPAPETTVEERFIPGSNGILVRILIYAPKTASRNGGLLWVHGGGKSGWWANRSIGLETAKQLSKKGLFVYLGSRDLQKGKTVVKELNENGFSNFKAIAIDVTNPETIAAAKNSIEKEQGKLDVLINNAGISGSFPQHASDTSIKDMQTVFHTNFFGVISVTQAFLELLKKSDSPRISNIKSGLGSLTLHNDPRWKYYAVKSASYGTSKAALSAYTIVLAYELKDLPFKVNVIDPGYTATDFNNHNGPGTLESAATFIIKHTITDNNAPTGKFFSNDIEDGTEVSPW